VCISLKIQPTDRPVGKFPGRMCVVQVAYLRPSLYVPNVCAVLRLYFMILSFSSSILAARCALGLLCSCARRLSGCTLWVIIMACVCRTKGMCARRVLWIVAYFFTWKFIAPHFSTSFFGTKDASLAWSKCECCSNFCGKRVAWTRKYQQCSVPKKIVDYFWYNISFSQWVKMFMEETKYNYIFLIFWIHPANFHYFFEV